MDTPFMGLILDTSTLIHAERARQSLPDIFARLRTRHGNVASALSAVTVVELAHGIERAQTDSQRRHRQGFLNDLTGNLTVYPLTVAVADLAGRVAGRGAARGVVIPFEDLLIGATALHHGFAVVTDNAKHFQLIPNLVVKPF